MNEAHDLDMLARRVFLTTALGLIALPRYPAAKEVAGVTLPDTVRPAGGKAEIRLLGGGLFRFLFVRYYVCGLYASANLSGANAIFAADLPRRVHLVALRRITSFEFLWGLDKGVKDNLSDTDTKALHTGLEQIRRTIRDIGAIAPPARVSIDYVPDAGTTILVGERPRGATIPGKLLNDALMRTWIGERPLDAALKEALLGA